MTVTDGGGLTDQDTAVITVRSIGGGSTVLFSDSFESSLWSQDVYNAWFLSSLRATDGVQSAQVDGYAPNARLTSAAVNLQGRTSATVTFSWYIEQEVDAGEYLAFDVSLDGGVTWTEKARINGDVDPEEAWRNVTIPLTNLTQLKLRFRAKLSSSSEDGNIDNVRVTAP